MILARSEGIPSVTTASFPSFEEAEIAFKSVENFDNYLDRNGVCVRVRVTRLYEPRKTRKD
jgi:hypothetical protein